ncbi:hypothetical protein A5661_24920 [Mycobacterium asiaticum]|nr:hypothetical protein A5661_24920 [Mycobacterium asiaticum]
MWSVANKTDGLIEPDDLPMIPGMTDDAPDTLVKAQLWTALDTAWIIADFQETQTSRSEHEILANARAREREKKARQRARAAEDADAGHSDVPGDSPGGPYRGTTQAGRQDGRKVIESNQQGKGDSRARVRENGAQPYIRAAAQQARIDAKIRAAYET